MRRHGWFALRAPLLGLTTLLLGATLVYGGRSRAQEADPDGHAAPTPSAVSPQQRTAKNRAPRPDAGGPYFISVNSGAGADSWVEIDHTGSSDPDGTIVKYEWDLDRNGSYDFIIDESAKLGVTKLPSGNNYIQGGQGQWEDRGDLVAFPWHKLGSRVRLRVTDNRGATQTDEANVPRFTWEYYSRTAGDGDLQGNDRTGGQAISPATLECPSGYLASALQTREDTNSPFERIIGVKMTCRRFDEGSVTAIFRSGERELVWGSQQSLQPAGGQSSNCADGGILQEVSTRTRSAAPEQGALRWFRLAGTAQCSIGEYTYRTFGGTSVSSGGCAPRGNDPSQTSIGVVRGIKLFAAEAAGPDGTVWVRGVRLLCAVLERESDVYVSPADLPRN